jgi:hypothetical protein
LGTNNPTLVEPAGIVRESAEVNMLVNVPAVLPSALYRTLTIALLPVGAWNGVSNHTPVPVKLKRRK